MTDDKLGQDIFKLDAEVDELVSVGNRLIMELSRCLYNIKEQALYAPLGYETFNAYVASKGMVAKTVHARLNVYKTLVVDKGYRIGELADISWHKLQAILPEVREKSREVSDEWIEKARQLTRFDLEMERKEEAANEGFTEHRSYPQLYRCRDCGRWQLPKDIELCEC